LSNLLAKGRRLQHLEGVFLVIGIRFLLSRLCRHSCRPGAIAIPGDRGHGAHGSEAEPE